MPVANQQPRIGHDPIDFIFGGQCLNTRNAVGHRGEISSALSHTAHPARALPDGTLFSSSDFRGEPRLRGYAANRWRVGLNPLRSRYPSLHAQTERTKSPSTAPPMLRAASLGTTGNDPPWPHRVRVLRKELKRSAISEIRRCLVLIASACSRAASITCVIGSWPTRTKPSPITWFAPCYATDENERVDFP